VLLALVKEKADKTHSPHGYYYYSSLNVAMFWLLESNQKLICSKGVAQYTCYIIISV